MKDQSFLDLENIIDRLVRGCVPDFLLLKLFWLLILEKK